MGKTIVCTTDVVEKTFLNFVSGFQIISGTVPSSLYHRGLVRRDTYG